MSENNIPTVAASDDRVTLYIDLGTSHPDDTIKALFDVGYYLGDQGIQVHDKQIEDLPDIALFNVTLSTRDAVVVKLRFKTVPEADVLALHEVQKTQYAQHAQSAAYQQQVAAEMVLLLQAIPDWNDPAVYALERDKVRDHAVNHLGMTPQDVMDIIDHKIVVSIYQSWVAHSGGSTP